METIKENAEQRVVFENALLHLHAHVEREQSTLPTCYLSYARGDLVDCWKDPRVKPWVARLAEDLLKAGLVVVFDQRSNTTIGANIHPLLEQMNAADKILVVCTPEYLREYQHRSETGNLVSSEMDIIARRAAGSAAEQASVYPLMVSGNERASLPPLLRRRKYFDFRIEPSYFATVFDLILSFYNIPVEHATFAEWRTALRGDDFEVSDELDEPEVTTEQLQAALKDIGREARQEAFSAGRPVIMLKNNVAVWVYADGAEVPADWKNGTPRGSNQ